METEVARAGLDSIVQTAAASVTVRMEAHAAMAQSLTAIACACLDIVAKTVL